MRFFRGITSKDSSSELGQVIIIPQIEHCCDDGEYPCVIVGQKGDEVVKQCVCEYEIAHHSCIKSAFRKFRMNLDELSFNCQSIHDSPSRISNLAHNWLDTIVCSGGSYLYPVHQYAFSLASHFPVELTKNLSFQLAGIHESIFLEVALQLVNAIAMRVHLSCFPTVPLTSNWADFEEATTWWLNSTRTMNSAARPALYLICEIFPEKSWL